MSLRGVVDSLCYVSQGICGPCLAWFGVWIRWPVYTSHGDIKHLAGTLRCHFGGKWGELLGVEDIHLDIKDQRIEQCFIKMTCSGSYSI